MPEEEHQEIDELISIKDIHNKQNIEIIEDNEGYQFNTPIVENRRSVDPNIDKMHNFSSNRINSEKQLLIRIKGPNNPFKQIK